MVKRAIFDTIFKEMQNIRYRLDKLESNITSWSPQPAQIAEPKLISLPDHLRKTYVVVLSKGECSAGQISTITGRSRAIESSNLNQLLRMGWLNKRRISKTVYFRSALKDTESNATPS